MCLLSYLAFISGFLALAILGSRTSDIVLITLVPLDQLGLPVSAKRSPFPDAELWKRFLFFFESVCRKDGQGQEAQ
uniref:Uncharacterized protein n=1 Tax=Anguilla anguilla TaxID=7936 RepID=A0A0E9QE80_ANGAN